jgi:hypothetical protein
MKVFSTVGILFLVISFLMGFFQIKGCIKSNYEYEKEIGSYWSLADKSSTISEKSRYIQQFIIVLEKSNHSEYNAIWLKTLDNSFNKNLEALKSLNLRLNQLKNMDIESFAYQTAIQQITAQEQGEAHQMLGVLEGCWVKDKYFICWNWFAIIFASVYSLLFIVGGCMLFYAYDSY